MQFTVRKRRQTPSVIIISLIDILIVLLIFLMVTTTFKQQPAVKIVLPESNQPKIGSSESASVQVTVAKAAPYLYLETIPVTLTKLQQELTARAGRNPNLSLTVRPDTDAPFGQVIKVMDAAKAAKMKVTVLTQKPAK